VIYGIGKYEMMNAGVHEIYNFPFEVETSVLLKKLGMGEDDPYADEPKHLILKAQELAKPRALVRIAYIESRGDDYVVVDRVRLKSRVLRVNLEKAHRVFCYLATCGSEIEDWARKLDDPLHRYWGDELCEMALGEAMKGLNRELEERYLPGKSASMSPGSLKDWPLEEQRPLFSLLGNTKESIGVELTDSLLMVPTKTVSGIRFPTEESFESCQLCPREECPGRRAPYDKNLYENKYRK
jgi:hypothetical protein